MGLKDTLHLLKNLGNGDHTELVKELLLTNGIKSCVIELDDSGKLVYEKSSNSFLKKFSDNVKLIQDSETLILNYKATIEAYKKEVVDMQDYQKQLGEIIKGYENKIIQKS